MVIQAIAGNATLKSAAGRAGIGYSTFNRWMREGHDDPDSPYRQFWEAVTRAEDEAQVSLAALWTMQAATDWRAARDLLARRHPDEWGPKLRVQEEHSGTINVIRFDGGGDPADYLSALVQFEDEDREAAFGGDLDTED